MRTSLTIAAVLMAALRAKTAEPPTVTSPATEPPTVATRQVASFVGDFERGDFSNWDAREAARPDSVQIVTDVVRRGRYAAKFTVRPGERVSNGNRAELLHDNGDHPGSQSWYAWSFLVPRDFADTEWRPKLWQCVGQWHDQPDPQRGETWATFPGHSPAIALYYTSKHGASALELWYGAKKQQDILVVEPIRKGEWLDVVFHIGWSPDAAGFVEAWLNGQPLIAPHRAGHRVFGANMWNAYPHFLKVGLYRTSEITTTNSVYFDEVRVGSSYEEVALPAAAAPKP